MSPPSRRHPIEKTLETRPPKATLRLVMPEESAQPETLQREGGPVAHFILRFARKNENGGAKATDSDAKWVTSGDLRRVDWRLRDYVRQHVKTSCDLRDCSARAKL